MLPARPIDSLTSQASAVRAAIEAESTIPQRGIFVSSSLARNLSISYNESVTLRFDGSISAERMTRAVERLVERHDALRASFDETGHMMKITRLSTSRCRSPICRLFNRWPADQ